MTTTEILLTGAVTLLFVLALLLFLRLHKERSDRKDLIQRYEGNLMTLHVAAGNREAIIADAQRALLEPPARFEIRVVDWGIEYGEMRFRWTIFEADAVVRLALTLPADLNPTMLGNAPTREEAYAAALLWVEEHTVNFSGPAGPEVRWVAR